MGAGGDPRYTMSIYSISYENKSVLHYFYPRGRRNIATQLYHMHIDSIIDQIPSPALLADLFAIEIIFPPRLHLQVLEIKN